jgi:hypothetical protein
MPACSSALPSLARAAPVADNRRLRLLPGYVDYDIADLARRDEKYDDALAAIERACALGDHADFLIERAHIRRRRKELDRALADADASKACDLGVNEGCTRAKQVAPR